MSRDEAGRPPMKNQTEAQRRDARRAIALRENLRRRKQQDRARVESDAETAPAKRDT
jgi:hypothetical protein